MARHFDFNNPVDQKKFGARNKSDVHIEFYQGGSLSEVADMKEKKREKSSEMWFQK